MNLTNIQSFSTILFLFISLNLLAQPSNMNKLITPFEKNDQYSASYPEAIEFFDVLVASYPQYLHFPEAGETDSGFPLQTLIVDKNGLTRPQDIRSQGRMILFVNNAIHPGEPEGVDASMMWVRDILNAQLDILDKISIVIIPWYNIDGGLVRKSHGRANQDGPELYGFRANFRNLDLNRDFSKCDTRNAQSFNKIFTHWSPDFFVDNHTSNGADYQYTMTLIPTQKDKLAPPQGKFLQETVLPFLYSNMEKAGWEMTPYVYAEDIPDKGIMGFLDLPRYSTGYAATHNVIGFMPETHMLKPFKDRVKSTYAFLQAVLTFCNEQKDAILKTKNEAIQFNLNSKTLDIDWKLDATKNDSFLFKGYEAGYKASKVSGLPRLFYDRNKPFTKSIPFSNTYIPSLSVEVPSEYIIPQAWKEVIDRLEWNGVVMSRLQEDTILDIEVYKIKSFKTLGPYEGHYLYSKTIVEPIEEKRLFRKGDYRVSTRQNARNYLVQMLEPQAPDGFFSWNFFDGILNQKEYFSDYIFEDLAAEILEKNPSLRKELEEAKLKDKALAASANAQLEWVYVRSEHYENSHKVYPIAKIK
jgi:hypothetical protein